VFFETVTLGSLAVMIALGADLLGTRRAQGPHRPGRHRDPSGGNRGHDRHGWRCSL